MSPTLARDLPKQETAPEMEGVDIDVAVTLREGVEHDNGLIRYVVVEHVYKQKPRLKLAGISRRRVCPVCNRTCATERGVRVHFGAQHSGHPWPFIVHWKPDVVRKRGRTVSPPSNSPENTTAK